MTTKATHRRLATMAAVATVALLAAVFAADARAANFSLLDFGGSATAADGSPETQAGSHPDLEMHFKMSTHLNPSGERVADANIKDVSVELPAGLIGDPTVGPKCGADQLADTYCPAGSFVGYVKVHSTFFGPELLEMSAPLANMEPPSGVVARFGFNVLNTIVVLDARLTASGEYRVVVDSRNTSQGLAVVGFDATLWGVPADPKNDAGRAGLPSGQPRRPFISLPTTCPEQPHVTRITLNSWQFPGEWLTSSFSADGEGRPLVTENCGALSFDPSLALRPETRAADAPTGLDVDLGVPQNESPDGLATAHLKDVRVVLPEGLSVNPGSADGLAACSDAQLGLGDDEPVSCPGASQIGKVSAFTPLLEEELGGKLFVRSQASDDPASGEMFRLALVVDSEERGVRVKLAGRLVVDPVSGRITAVFANNPQVPVESIRLSLKSGPRAPLATPASCGQKTVEAELSSWSGKTRQLAPSFGVDCAPGLGGFDPSMAAGVVSPSGGAFSPFTAALSKPDGDADLTGLRMELPTGLLAKLKGNLGSQVGTVRTFAGPGTNPLLLPGKVFLEGAYGDAPYSLRVVVPAKAGPFDLGEVVVRQKVYVDRDTAQVSVVSDPFPTVVKGVPVRLQRVEVDVDKPGFIVNPTSCEATKIEATLSSAVGQSVPITNRFQVGDCANLSFTPKLALRLTGAKQTRTGRHPGVRATVRQPASGGAGIAQAKVTLPKSLALDPDNAQALCEFDDGTRPDLENHCPKGSVIGKARAVSALLDRPLTGKVFFVKNVEKNPRTGALIRKLPMLVVALRGQIAINLQGKSSTSKDGRLVNTFAKVPDAPVTRFNLNIGGGTNGILAVTRTRRSKIDLCTSPRGHRAQVDMDGHNAKQANFATRVKTPCAKTAKRTGKRAAGKRAAGKARRSARTG